LRVLILILSIMLIFTIFSMCMDKNTVNNVDNGYSGNANLNYSKLKGIRILMVIAPKDFRDEELLIPMEIFKKNGCIVEVVSTKKGECIGMLGHKIMVNKTIYEVNSKDYDAIVIVGGTGSPKYLWDNEELHKLVKSFYNEGKVVSAICLSPVVLAKSGICKGKKLTVYPTKDSIEEIEKYGGIYINNAVVSDGNIITASGPKEAKIFAYTILNRILINYMPTKINRTD